MHPVQSASPSTENDNEATAELPVLDVAAYEATLDDSLGNTDTWNLPSANVAAPTTIVEAIPTLRPADSDDALDLSGTHEMPALPKPNKVAVTPAAATTPALPPSPPLIEELRGALAAAERRIEELNERARIADAERSVAVARVNAENAQLRASWNDHRESLPAAAAV